MIFFYHYQFEQPPKSPGGGLIYTIFKVFAPLRGVWGAVLSVGNL
jgi:hypothetical protein